MNSDDIFQSVFKAIKNVKWRDIDENPNYEWYYAEEMHYVIHNKTSNAYWFIKGRSPQNAYEIIRKKDISE